MREDKKTGKERTQQATRDEEWSEERLKSFLDILPPQGMDADYNILLRAYRGMTAELFARFIPLYIESGRDINVSHSDGSSILDLLSQHRRSIDYATAVSNAGGEHRLGVS